LADSILKNGRIPGIGAGDLRQDDDYLAIA
jgi:hypothetical protein